MVNMNLILSLMAFALNVAASSPDDSSSNSNSSHRKLAGTFPTDGVRGIPFPYQRYRFWNDLDNTDQGYASDMGYVSPTWNWPTKNAIEGLSYFTIRASNAVAFAGLLGLGYEEEQWDCFINHYGEYDWNELADEGVQIYFVQLGWTRSSWNGATPPPDTDDSDWSELSPQEKRAAGNLCYWEELWQELPFAQWPSLPVPPETPSPTVPKPTSPPSPTIPQPTNSPVTPSPTTPSKECKKVCQAKKAKGKKKCKKYCTKKVKGSKKSSKSGGKGGKTKKWRKERDKCRRKCQDKVNSKFKFCVWRRCNKPDPKPSKGSKKSSSSKSYRMNKPKSSTVRSKSRRRGSELNV